MEVEKDDPECSIVKTTSINYTTLIIDFVIRAALHFIFRASCAHNLYINH
jgi:CRISPR/Cas system-associated protein Csx1